MNRNQLPWCRCHNEKTLHYFFRETYPALKTGRTRKQLMIACHECGSPGNQAVKKTPEMRQDWLDSLPVLKMDAYQDYRYWLYDEPRPYTIGYQLNKKERPLHEHLKRLRKDRRTHYGHWFLYEKHLKEPNKFWHDPFADNWHKIKHGDLKFPEGSLILDEIVAIGLRRAVHAKHPLTLQPIENPERWYPYQYYYRRDRETGYISYLVVIIFNEDYLVKVELDLDLIITAEIQGMLKIIPEWTERELPKHPEEKEGQNEAPSRNLVSGLDRTHP